MPDWNQAEILGPHPHPLDTSIYRHLITDRIWHEARTSLGYGDVGPAPLLRTFLGRGMIDVRHSFNSLLPRTLPYSVRERLVDICLDHLAAHPHLQDKVEFEVIPTTWDFDFEDRLAFFRDKGLSASDAKHLQLSFIDLTRRLLSDFPRLLQEDLDAIRRLGDRHQLFRDDLGHDTPWDVRLQNALLLLDDARRWGTLPQQLELKAAT